MTRTHALLGLSALTLALAAPHPAQAQDYTLSDNNDTLTINGSGTSGTLGGTPFSYPGQTTVNGFVQINGNVTDASVTVGPGGTISEGGGDGVLNYGDLSDVVSVTGGSVTGNGGEGIGNFGTLDLSGGTVTGGSDGIGNYGSGVVNISGGSVTSTSNEDLYNDGGTVNFFGTGFEIGGAPVTGPDTTSGDGTLTGTLADGQMLSLMFNNTGTLTFNAPAAPEPSGLTLVGMMALPLAGLLLRARRRNRV